MGHYSIEVRLISQPDFSLFLSVLPTEELFFLTCLYLLVLWEQDQAWVFHCWLLAQEKKSGAQPTTAGADGWADGYVHVWLHAWQSEGLQEGLERWDRPLFPDGSFQKQNWRGSSESITAHKSIF